MFRVNCQVFCGLLVICACDGAHPGLLGEYISKVQQKHAAELDAAAPSEPVTPPVTPQAGAPAPSPPPPNTPTPQPKRQPDYVAVSRLPGSVEPGLEVNYCVATDLTVTQDTWVTAIEVAPQHAAYAKRATVNISRDARCDALEISTDILFDYRPNNARFELADGDAMLLPARSRLAVQVRLNTMDATDTSTDATRMEVRLWTLPKGERPKHQVVRGTFHAFDITIPVDAVGVEVRATAAFDETHTRPMAEIIGFNPKLNELGQRMTAEVVASDGTRTTLFDFPDWSLDARKDHLLAPSPYIPLADGSLLTHSCEYSNRLEDQALDPSGEPLEPQLTTFGEGERQEMCAVSFYIRHPL